MIHRDEIYIKYVVPNSQLNNYTTMIDGMNEHKLELKTYKYDTS